MRNLILILLSGLVIIGCTNSQESVNPAMTQGNEVKVLPVTAVELISAYASNEVEADKEYKGKLLEIEGSILDVGTGLTEDIIVQLGAEESLLNILVKVKKISSLTNMKGMRGQKVTVICKGSGEISGWPLLTSCTFK